MKYCTNCHAYFGNDVTTCPADDTVLRTASELAQGMIIGRKYEILKEIGAGGMASVYLARHLAFDEIRAIKVVRGWMAEDEGFLRRLRSEAVMLRRLKHPNAVRVDDIDNFEDGRPFIVMEYVEGTDLHSFIRAQGPLPVPRVLSIASQVASALAAAHKLGIIHRDIKPDNILLVQQEDGSEFVKVLDFGIAKLLGPSAGDAALTQPGLVLCTPGYASPEQARGLSSDQLDGRSDLYSLGLVMYEMLTGELPFHSDTPMGMLIAQIITPPRPPAELKPELQIPSAVSDLLMKSLEKDPSQRFQSAEEMLETMAQLEDVEFEPAPDADQNDVATLPEVAMTNIRWRVNQASAAAAPQSDYSEEPQQLLLDIDEPVGGMNHLWIWALAAMIVLAVAGTFTYVRSHRSLANPAAAAPRPSDRDILVSVVEKLVAIEGAQDLRASVSQGVVSLTGEAPGQFDLEEAAKSISTVSGVLRVNKSGVRVLKATSSSAPTTVRAKSPQPSPEAAKLPKPSAMAGPSSPSPAISSSPSPSASPEARDADAATSLTPGASNRVRDLMKKAQLAMDDGQYDLANKRYAAVLKIDPGNSAARAGKSKAERAKQYEEQMDNQE